MKKCYWCAEEIQDEARICRYCGRDPADPTAVSLESVEKEPTIHFSTNSGTSLPFVPPPIQRTDNLPQQETHEFPPLKWHQKLLTRAIFFGCIMAIILAIYTLNSTYPTEAFGYLGYLNNILMQGFSNVLIYSIVYLAIGGLFRLLSKKDMDQDFEKRQEILGVEFFVVVGIFIAISMIVMMFLETTT